MLAVGETLTGAERVCTTLGTRCAQKKRKRDIKGSSSINSAGDKNYIRSGRCDAGGAGTCASRGRCALYGAVH